MNPWIGSVLATFGSGTVRNANVRWPPSRSVPSPLLARAVMATLALYVAPNLRAWAGLNPNSVSSLDQVKVPATAAPASSVREKAASVLARSIAMENVAEIGCSILTASVFSGCHLRSVGSAVWKRKV